ncbi:holin [Mycobacterium phage prophiGD11-3]|nr:holin [Mycobacterium phage prophiGD11-3]
MCAGIEPAGGPSRAGSARCGLEPPFRRGHTMPSGPRARRARRDFTHRKPNPAIHRIGYPQPTRRGVTMINQLRALNTPANRQYLYRVAVVLLGALAFYNIIDPAAIPLWLDVVGTVLGVGVVGTANHALKGQRRDGIL